eukprot:m.35522 g.35522  ORF g.35522 m.35522 type:complete len:785 (-) comp10931_c0_seq2:5714-8068(-)
MAHGAHFTTSGFVLACCFAVAVALPAASSGSGLPPFRPAAIPLITTDPYIQTWVRADNTTGDEVRHWDGSAKEMRGLVRIDGQTFRFLGRIQTPGKPGPFKSLPGHDVSPGSHDISNSHVSVEQCNILCYAEPQCQAYIMHGAQCYLKSTATPVVSASKDVTAYIVTGQHHPPVPDPIPALVQDSVVVLPTRTEFVMRDPANRLQLKLTFLSSLLDHDYNRLSRPVSYIWHRVTSLDGKAHSVQLYLDASANHAVNTVDEPVVWESVSTPGGVAGGRIGSAAQNVLGSKGDRVNIDWGYLYLTAAASSSRTGGATKQQASFAANGTLPTTPDTRMPRPPSDDLPSIAIVKDLGDVMTEVSHIVLYSYDDIFSVEYYGTPFQALWKKTWPTMEAALDAAYVEFPAVSKSAGAVDDKVVKETLAAGGDKYAAIAALAYRQTLAATKLVWNNESKFAPDGADGVVWNFLKEISTNGDMQTMDVVFPASPMLLYSNPDLLKRLLIPVLAFANNETNTPFSNPFSPHQIGTYPIADATTKSQEPMPMENTGNMFLMLAGIASVDKDTSFFYPRYWPLLKTWAAYLNASLPYPADQLCTDDFTGRLANNSNLAAKGIVALSAFANLCHTVGDASCTSYEQDAERFAGTWQQEALEKHPTPHYKIAYNVPNSYSVKYNLVWQKLLGLNGPFPQHVIDDEVAYYLKMENNYGTPLDFRHTYQKLDWLSWAAVLGSSETDFNALFDPIFLQANNTSCRVPLTDLFDTVSADCSRPSAFIARPVVGGVFAKMLV